MAEIALPEVIARQRPLVEAALRAAIGDAPARIDAAARYVMGWETTGGARATATGKRIRPALVLVAAEAVGGRAEDGLPGAVAIELIHNFSLVHDEIQDQDAERHGRPTAYTIWGPAQAINLGDYLYARAIHALANGPVPAERRVAALDALLRAIEGMIRGQWRDLEFESAESVTVDDYLAMVEGKTGVLLGAALEMGALLGGAPRPTASTLGQWGTRLGLAFQVIDDYLGTWGDQALTGKSTTGDIARKKKTLPVVHGLHDPVAGPLIRAAFDADRQVAELPAIVAALERAGAPDLCRALARRFADEADALLDSLDLSREARDGLRTVGDYFVHRTF
jgi:geranylgeranyl diphosphate synthase type I